MMKNVKHASSYLDSHVMTDVWWAAYGQNLWIILRVKNLLIRKRLAIKEKIGRTQVRSTKIS